MPIKVKLIGQKSSSGRGVGYYRDFLERSLNSLPDIDLVNTGEDIDHYTFFDLFYPTLPFHKSKPTVVTVHDLTPLVLSELYPKGIKGTFNLIHQRLSLMNVQAIITDSHCSKKDLSLLFHLSEDKIFAIPLASDPEYQKHVSEETLKTVAGKYNLPSEFILTVAGGPNPNKNLPALAEACSELHIPLVIVGGGVAKKLPDGPVHPELRDLVKLQTYRHVMILGFVPTPDLSAIYRLSNLYCQPSLYEGFGLPLLEAMNTGTLVVSSNKSSLPEIYSDKTITFNPSSVGSMVKALEKALNLTDHQKQHYIRAAQHKAYDFSWDLTARATLSVYKRVLKSQ